MKKYLILFVAAVSSVFVGCDSDDDHNFNYVTFEGRSMNLAVNEDSSNSMEVTVYTGNVTGNARTFDIHVDESTTLNPAAYTVPATITIPANTNETTFTVDVNDSGLDNAGDLLVLSLGKEQGLFTGDPLTVNVTKICEFEPTGTLTNTSGWFGSEFPVEVVAGANPNQYVIRDFFSEGSDITFTVNADYSVSVPAQHAWVHGTHGQASVTGQAGSKIEPCLQKVTLILRHTVAAGAFGNFTEVLTAGGTTPVDEVDEDEDTEEDEEDEDTDE